MSTRKLFSILVGSVALCGLLVSCAGAATTSTASPSASPKPSPTPTPLAATADQLVALGDQVFPAGTDPTSQQGGTAYFSCGPYTNYSACPLTPRLQARLQQSRYWLCRSCGTGATSRTITATPTTTGGVVHAVLGSRSGGAEHFDLIVVNDGGQLLVDDEICSGGGPNTSIYKDPAGPGDYWACPGA